MIEEKLHDWNINYWKHISNFFKISGKLTIMTTFGKKTQCIVVDKKIHLEVFTQELHLINKHASKPLYSFFCQTTCYDVCVQIIIWYMYQAWPVLNNISRNHTLINLLLAPCLSEYRGFLTPKILVCNT